MTNPGRSLAVDLRVGPRDMVMSLGSLSRSLSARLLVMTVLFVMLAEVLIYTPSIARFRLVFLMDKLAEGHLAALSVVAAPDAMVTDALEQELLDSVGAYMIDLRRPREQRTYILGDLVPPEPDIFVDLGERKVLEVIADGFDTLLNGGDRVLRVEGPSPRESSAYVLLIMDEAELHKAMVDFSWRILALSVVISLITATLVFAALHWLTVRPLTRFTEKMVAFRENPDDAGTIIVPSGRGDEVGVAQRELHHMQSAIRAALKQRDRLAALGTAVTKINHDLRNILATASLVSERLAMSDNPEVQRTATQLFEAIDRATELCQRTLAYTRDSEPPLQLAEVNLHELVAAVETDVSVVHNGESRWINSVPTDLAVHADREQLRRVLVNLGRNAFQSGASRVTVSAAQEPDGIAVSVADNGPGLPPRAREHLFKPFAGSARPGGTGLGLAISREILEAHRGELRLVDTGAQGTTFGMRLPG